MKKNVAGQKVGCQMVSATDGSAFTGTVTVFVTGDAGTQAVGSVGSGLCTHEGNGLHTYAPAQAETNYDLIEFTFTGSGAVPQSLHIYTSFPQSGDSFPTVNTNLDAAISSRMATFTLPTNFASLVIDVSGRVDVSKIAGTAQTARDIGASVLLSSGVGAGQILLSAGQVTVGTNNDKTGYAIGVGGITASSFAAAAIDAAAIATDAIGAAELAQSAAQEIADEVLNRDIAGGTSGGARNVRSALRRLRNRVNLSGGTGNVYQEDDSTIAWTSAVTTTPGDPVTQIDPA